MTRRTPIIAIITIGLMCCFDTTNPAATGYSYEHPIRPFNPPPFSTLRSTGPYDRITIGQKVVASPRPRITPPPLPTFNPLTSLTQNTRLQLAPYLRAQPTPNTYTRQDQYQVQQQQLAQQRQQQQQQQQQQLQQQRQKQQQQQQLQQQRQQQQQLAQQQQAQFQRAQQAQRLQPPQQQQQQQVQQQLSYPRAPVRTQYTYNQPQKPFPITIQQRISPQAPPRPTIRLTPGPTTKLSLRPTPIPTQKLTPRPVARPTPRPVISQRPYTPPSINIPARPASVLVPTTVATPTVSISNPSQAGLVTPPDVYIIDGRRLKQYKVYEEIDNDIDQEVENFIPANFFLNSYHARIGPTHSINEDFQLASRFSSPLLEANNQQGQQQQQNTIALGSGGLGFVKLPNGNVYLGSGSLGYISGLQRSQDVEDARTRTGASTPDPVHFGHGPLSDSFYYQSN